MLKNYFIVALRNLWRYKIYSVLNIFGLAIGIAAFILIMQYVSFELSYDTFQEEGKNMYRVQANQYHEGRLELKNAFTPPALGPTLSKSIPEIEHEFRLTSWADSYTVLVANKKGTADTYKEEKAVFADPAFIQYFDFDFLKQSSNKILQSPATMIISASQAEKYYGSNWSEKIEPHKTIITVYNSNRDDAIDFVIEGVFEDMPLNSHLNYDLIFSHQTLPYFLPKEIPDEQRWEMFENSWGPASWYTYLVLNDNAQADSVAAKINDYMAGIHPAEVGNRTAYLLQPIADIHLQSRLANEPGNQGNREWVMVMLVIAVLIISIAWINYINLSTVKAMDRAREISLRKVSGANRGSLVFQFLIEAGCYNLMSLLLALTITQIAIPYFSSLTGVKIGLLDVYYLNPVLYLGLVLILGILITGVYPVYVLTRINPAKMLKGKLKSKPKGILLRQSLVVFQFAASLALLVGTVVIYRQVQFMRNQDLGFDGEQIMVIEGPNVLEQEMNFAQTVRQLDQALEGYQGIEQVTASSAVPGTPSLLTRSMQRQDQVAMGFKELNEVLIDEDYLPLLSLKLLSGRNFMVNEGQNGQKMLINEAALDFYDFESAEAAIGRRLGMQSWSGISEYEIIGVVENFHQKGLKHNYQPIGFFHELYKGEYLVQISTVADLNGTINLIGKQWNKLFPDNPFEYYFLDNYFNQQYHSDQSFGRVFGIFSALAIAIASMGLFGLTAFYAFQKSKEISIRKLMGASLGNIIRLLSKEFIMLILIAAAIAIPLAYRIMQIWLEDYAFRIEIQWWMLLLPLLTILLITVLTMAYQTLKAALTKPVEVLRYE